MKLPTRRKIYMNLPRPGHQPLICGIGPASQRVRRGSQPWHEPTTYVGQQRSGGPQDRECLQDNDPRLVQSPFRPRAEKIKLKKKKLLSQSSVNSPPPLQGNYRSWRDVKNKSSSTKFKLVGETEGDPSRPACRDHSRLW